MPYRSFPQALSRLRELAQQDKLTHFEMGDVSLDQVALGATEPERLKQMAEAAGLTNVQLEQRRLVAARVPLGWRSDEVSWSVYREIVKHTTEEDTVRGLCAVVAQPNPTTESKRWTASSIRVLMGLDPIMHTGTEPLAQRLASAPIAQKIEAATVLLNDLAVAEEAMNTGTRLGQRTYDLREEHDRRVTEATRRMVRDTEQRDNADPVVQKLTQMQAVNDLTGVYADAAAKATDLLHIIHQLPPAGDDPLADRVFLTEAIDRLKATIEATEDLLAGRAQGVDAFFASVMKEARG
jgi:hypothetical protein